MALAPYTPRFWPYRMLYWMGTVPVTNKVYVKLTNLPKWFGLLHYGKIQIYQSFRYYLLPSVDLFHKKIRKSGYRQSN